MGLRRLPQKVIWAAFFFIGALIAGSWLLLNRGKDLEVYGLVPDFSLIERSGRKVQRADFEGKVWVTNFIYTHCPHTCPFQNAELVRLQADLAAERDFRIVSFTVDPELDTPEVLSRFADQLGADPERWLFLTGDKKTIYRLASEGFRLSVVDPREAAKGPHALAALLRFIQPRAAWAHHGEPLQLFSHSPRFVLVDRGGQIRGYYHSDEREDLRRLRLEALALLRKDEHFY